MRAGKLDRQIVIEHCARMRDPNAGVMIDGPWTQFAKLWADVTDVPPSRGERIAEGISVANRPCRIRIRFRSGITNQMRVRLDGRTLQIITMPAEIGRREMLEFMAEEITTKGQKP